MRNTTHEKTIGIYTKNFSLYHDLVKTLKRRGIPYVSLASTSHIPRKIHVILTSHAEIHTLSIQNAIAADAYDTIDQAIDKALHLIIGKDIYTTLYIGIDPGEKPGVAIVGDDILIRKTQVRSPELVKPMVQRIIQQYPSYEYLIRVGHGSIITRNRIINTLISLGISIEIVDESKTSSSQQTKRTHRDSEAAASIALMKGGKVQRRLPLAPTKGDIRNIQEKSRQLTDGRFTISQQSALKVLRGEKSLQEAIRQEQKKK
ncbi:hypothetical protein ACFL2V_08660 [Pseudomonadota bacterium]